MSSPVSSEGKDDVCRLRCTKRQSSLTKCTVALNALNLNTAPFFGLTTCPLLPNRMEHSPAPQFFSGQNNVTKILWTRQLVMRIERFQHTFKSSPFHSINRDHVFCNVESYCLCNLYPLSVRPCVRDSTLSMLSAAALIVSL